LGPGVIGSTNAAFVAGDYTTVRDQMAVDASDEASNGIVAFLPTVDEFSTWVPGGFTLNGNIILTKANAKALGFGTSGSDGTITFSDAFPFDFDNSDGVGAGLLDFETVALHEIGHLLGFISWVDNIDGAAATATYLTTLDLFRFRAADTPTTAAEFTNNPRTLAPAHAAVFSDTVNAWNFSMGVTQGDGRQASHWKDNSLTGVQIGVMDPTLSFGVVSSATYADARAFDLIGYDLVAVPEPGTFALMGVGLASLAYWRKRRS